jgi:hypothetical protein
MDKSEWAANAAICGENGESWILTYYVHTFAANRYGLRIDKCRETGQLAETETTPAFTDSHSEALTLARRFAQGSVPPCTLVEMTDEWLSA